MTTEEKKKLYAALSAPFPEEAIERTSGAVTGKGYDTAGVRAQWLINRINECCGVGAFRVHRTVEVREATSPRGRPGWDAHVEMTVELGAYDNGEWVAFAESLSDGGHFSTTSRADAIKGAHTGAFKRCVAAFGVGKAAWEGTLDDDNQPQETGNRNAGPESRTPARAQPSNRPLTAPRGPAVQPSAPPGYIASPEVVVRRQQASQQQRNRISSKQVSAIWAIARKLGLEQGSLRTQVKARFGGKTLEFLSTTEASELIDALGRMTGNGNSHNGAAPPEAA